MPNHKYEILKNDFIVVNNIHCYRIRAIKSFRIDVIDGQCGGYISSPRSDGSTFLAISTT